MEQISARRFHIIIGESEINDIFAQETDGFTAYGGIEATIQRHFSPNWNVFFIHLKVSLNLEFEAPKLVSVKARKRIIHGKVVKVRPFYRRVWGRTIVSSRIFS